MSQRRRSALCLLVIEQELVPGLDFEDIVHDSFKVKKEASVKSICGTDVFVLFLDTICGRCKIFSSRKTALS